jgi:hypothetical protein
MIERIALAVLVVGIVRPTFARAAEPELESRTELRLREALDSPADRHGIPARLYDLDAELAGHKATLEQMEGTAQFQGIFGAILLGGGVLIGLAAPDLVWAPFGMPTGIPWGYAIAGVGVVTELMFLGTLSTVEGQRKLLRDAFVARYGPAGDAPAHSARGRIPGGLVVLRW